MALSLSIFFMLKSCCLCFSAFSNSICSFCLSHRMELSLAVVEVFITSFSRLVTYVTVDLVRSKALAQGQLMPSLSKFSAANTRSSCIRHTVDVEGKPGTSDGLVYDGRLAAGVKCLEMSAEAFVLFCWAVPSRSDVTEYRHDRIPT